MKLFGLFASAGELPFVYKNESKADRIWNTYAGLKTQSGVLSYDFQEHTIPDASRGMKSADTYLLLFIIFLIKLAASELPIDEIGGQPDQTDCGFGYDLPCCFCRHNKVDDDQPDQFQN